MPLTKRPAAGLRSEYVLPYWDIVKKAVETAAIVDTGNHRAKAPVLMRHVAGPAKL